MWVAPHVGAWIEIYKWLRTSVYALVAPHVGAWIEIFSLDNFQKGVEVAPHVGAWIEITPLTPTGEADASHPTWVRGLKFTTFLSLL